MAKTATAETTEEVQAPEATNGKKPSPKSKEALGITGDVSLCWIPFPLTEAQNDVVEKVVKVQGYKKKSDLFVALLNQTMESQQAWLNETAAQYTEPEKKQRSGVPRKKIEEMSVEELQKASEAAQARLEASQRRAQVLLEAAKARAAAAANN